MRKWIVVLALVTVLGGAFASVAFSQAGLTPVAPPPAPEQDASDALPIPYPVDPDPVVDKADSLVRLPCTAPQQDLNFANFWVGPNYDGLRITAVIRRCDLPLADESVRANYVSYLYGQCYPDDEACAPPIEVQTWPAVERNKATITKAPDPWGIAGTDTTVNGKPATRYEGGRRLEIYMGDVTVVIFGDNPSLINGFSTRLSRGPVVLAEVSRYGLTFTPECMTLRDATNYCVAEPKPYLVDIQASLTFVIPLAGFLLALLVGRWWLVLLPVAFWTVYFLGLDAGLWGYGYGDGWLAALAFESAIGVAGVVIGLLFRWLGIRRAKSRRQAAG